MRLLAPTLAATAAAAFTLLAVPLAAADTPTAVIDRSLSLDPSTTELEAGALLLHNGAAVDPAPSNTEALEFSADYGVLHHLQVGAVLDLQVSPSSEFERALVTAQYQLLAFAALRLDVGAEHSGANRFAVGVGLPVRLKLTDTLAFVSSRPFSFADDDVLSARLGNGSFSTFRIPVGVLWQLDPHFALVGRTGVVFQDSADFIPLGVDALATLSRLDIGVTFDIAGQVSPSGSGYFDLLTVRGFVQLRI